MSEASSGQEISFQFFCSCDQDQNEVVDDDRFVVAHPAKSELACRCATS